MPVNQTKLCHGVVLLLLLFSISTSASAQTESDQLEQYLSEIHQHLTNSYAFADSTRSRTILQTGKDELLRALRKPNSNALPYSRDVSKKLVQRLQSRSLQSVQDLIQVLNETQEAVPSSTVNWLPATDTFATGMIEGTGDSFSRLLTMEDIKEIRDRLLGKGTNRSLGMKLAKKNDQFRVRYVLFRSAAYRAGLRAGDVIVKIGDQPLSDTTEAERNTLLQADPGVKRTVTFTRDHWNKAHEVQLEQLSPGADTVEAKLLPSNIGYVRLTLFGLTATGELRAALDELKQDGMESIILDLRNNPGGALPVAVDISDLFLGGNRVITTTDSNYELDGTLVRIVRQILGFEPLSGTRRADTDSPFEDQPMCVLINGSTASASELTAGALQDHERATIIGQTSFGKGIGQVAIPLRSSRGLGKSDELGFFGNFFPSRFLYLTVLTYRLPSGRSIHKKGVQPDLPVSLTEYSEQTFAAILSLRSSDLLTSYVRKHTRKQKERMESLAEYDRFEPDRYPSFEKLHERVRKNVSTKITASILRRELRRALRNYLRLYHNKTFTVDLQNDPTLQQGVLHLQD